MQICAPPTKNQCKVSETQVTVKACGHLGFFFKLVKIGRWIHKLPCRARLSDISCLIEYKISKFYYKQLCLICVSVFLQTLTFYFPDCGKLPPPVIMVQHVSFQYNESKVCCS